MATFHIARDSGIATESEHFRFVAFASDIGLGVGEWPQQIGTDLGNGQPFHMIRLLPDFALYRQALGCIDLRIFND